MPVVDEVSTTSGWLLAVVLPLDAWTAVSGAVVAALTGTTVSVPVAGADPPALV
jgi:hypothetical protein